jgi:hypothetical protein
MVGADGSLLLLASSKVHRIDREMRMTLLAELMLNETENDEGE